MSDNQNRTEDKVQDLFFPTTHLSIAKKVGAAESTITDLESQYELD